jgi:hypothetical protein
MRSFSHGVQYVIKIVFFIRLLTYYVMYICKYIHCSIYIIKKIFLLRSVSFLRSDSTTRLVSHPSLLRSRTLADNWRFTVLQMAFFHLQQAQFTFKCTAVPQRFLIFPPNDWGIYRVWHELVYSPWQRDSRPPAFCVYQPSSHNRCHFVITFKPVLQRLCYNSAGNR